MNQKNALDRLINLVNADQGMIPELIHDAAYRRTKVRLGTVYAGLAGRASHQAIFDYFVKSDIGACKQNFYLSAKLSLASSGMDGAASASVGLKMLSAMLSDNEEVIEELAKAEAAALASEIHDPKSSAAFQYRFNLAVLGRDRELEQLVEEVRRKGTKADRQAISNGEYFFSLLLARDSEKLKALIEKRHANIKSAWPAFEDFISYLGTLETKLCWRRGIPVQIDHPLVPMELMPVRPLDHYDDVYDFLKPGWVPPPQGLVGRISRWFKK